MMDKSRITLTAGESMTHSGQYYDPEMLHCFSRENSPIVSLSVPNLIRDFRRYQWNKYTIPVPLARVVGSGQGRERRPCMWESVDRTRGVGNSWSVVIGRSTGARQSRSGVQTVLYERAKQRFWDRGSHTLIRAEVGALIGLFRVHQGSETFIVLRVDEVLPWSNMCKYTPSAAYPAAAANVTLVYARTADRFSMIQNYVHEDLSQSVVNVGIQDMYTAARDMATNPNSRLRYARLFATRVGGRSATISRDINEDAEIHTYIAETPECFLGDLYAQIGIYRQFLHSKKSPHDSDALPVNLSYTVNPENEEEGTPKSVTVSAIIHSMHPDEFPHQAVETTLTDTIPGDMLAEPIVVTAASSVRQLIASIMEDPNPREVFLRA